MDRSFENCVGSLLSLFEIRTKFKKESDTNFKRKMLIFEVNKSLQRFIGLDSRDPTNSHIDYRRAIAFTLPMLSTFITGLVNFMVNLDDLNKATGSMHPLSCFVILFTIHWHLLINRNRFIDLMDDLNEIVNESTYHLVINPPIPQFLSSYSLCIKSKNK